MPDVVCVQRLTLPVGAMVNKAMFLRPYVHISSYNEGSASLILRIKGLFFSFSALYMGKAPLSFAICTDER